MRTPIPFVGKISDSALLRGLAACVLLGGLFAACSPQEEPPPTQYEDLGTEDRPLLPTGSTWNDPAIAKGTAEWKPYRKLDPAAAAPKPAEESADAKGGSALQGELLDLVKQFNESVASEKYEEAIDFLIEEQLDPGKKVIELLPKFAAKLGELVAALPGENENLKKLPAALALSNVLKLNVPSIEAKGEDEAVGPLDGATPPTDVRFVRVKEGGEAVWYIDHPQIRSMIQAAPKLEKSLEQFDTLIAGIKSGQITGEALAQQAAALDQMVKALMHAENPDAKPEAKEN